MTKNAYFGPNLVVIGPKILIFTGRSKSFGTHKKTPRQLVRIGFGRAVDQMVQKGQYLAKKVWANNPFFGGGSKILVPSYQGTNETPLLC